MKIAIGWLLLVGWEVENSAVCCQVRQKLPHTRFPTPVKCPGIQIRVSCKKVTATCNKNYFHGEKNTFFATMWDRNVEEDLEKHPFQLISNKYN